MKKYLFFYFTLILTLVTIPHVAYGSIFDLKISEIMYDPAGSDTWPNTSYTRDWIEITNTGSETVSIDENIRLCDSVDCGTGYHLLNKKNNFSISPGEIIVFADLSERFSEDYPNFKGTVIDTVLKLKKDSDFIGLFQDTNGQKTQIDGIIYSSAWGASDNGFSLEKVDLLGQNNASNWKQSVAQGGTPGALNSAITIGEDINPIIENNPAAETLDATQSSTPAQQNNAEETPEPAPEYSKEVFINEFYPDPPESIISDAKGEWIEIYNNGDNNIDLSLWRLDDIDGGSNPYTIPSGTIIAPKSYLVFSRQTTNIAINNDGDAVRLLWPNNQIADEVSYSGKAPEGQSYNKTEQEWQWSKILTPASANIIENQGTVEDNSQTAGSGQKLSSDEETNTEENAAIQDNSNDENLSSPAGEQIDQKNLSEEKEPLKINNADQTAAAAAINKKSQALAAIFWGLGIALFFGMLFVWLRKKTV